MKIGGGKMKRILFICKKRLSTYGISYGLLNSARFVASELEKHGQETKVVEVNDNNDIDKEVFGYKPTHVIIEALWVVPEKFDEIIPLHPNVKWIVRLHSKIPFLATESMAMKWIGEYIEKGVMVAFNNKVACNEISLVFGTDMLYLPNVYIATSYTPLLNNTDNINIGCFGAVRILKNHLQQAISAILFANKIKKKLNFYINTTDIEDANNAIVKNLTALFDRYPQHTLVKQKWLEHDDFVELVKTMDMGLQVSISESFNIVAADFAAVSVPIVVSNEIEWIPSWYRSAMDSLSIYWSLLFTWRFGRIIGLQKLNKIFLNEFSKKSVKIWLNFLKKEEE